MTGLQIKKKLTAFCLTVVLLLLFAGSIVLAEEEGNVYDGASLLSAGEISELNEKIEALEQASGWNVFAVTTGDAEGKTAAAYADDFFDAHSPEQEDGVALLIDMDNREIYISTCGEAIRYLTDERVEYVVDDAYWYVADGDYAGGLYAMVDGVASYYDRGIPGDQHNYDTDTGAISVYRSLTLTELLTAVVAALAVGGIFFGVTVGRYQLKFGTWKYSFREYGKLNLRVSEDRLVNKFVTHRRIPRQTSHSGSRSGGRSSGRSSTHRSSSGRSHGGGGRRF